MREIEVCAGGQVFFHHAGRSANMGQRNPANPRAAQPRRAAAARRRPPARRTIARSTSGPST